MKKIFECVGAQSRFLSEADSKFGGWGPCSIEHYEMVLKNPHEHEGYEVRLIFACKEVPGNSFSGLKEQMTLSNQLEASTLTMEKLGEQVAELEQKLAELRKLVPSGPTAGITCRKTRALLEDANLRTSGLVLANNKTGDRTIVDMGGVRWVKNGEFQKMMRPPLMYPPLPPDATSPAPTPGAAATSPAPAPGLKSFRMDAKGKKFSFRGEFADEIEADVREIPGGLSPLAPCQSHAAIPEPAIDSGRLWTGVDLDNTLARFDVFRGWDHIGEPIHETVNLVKELLANGEAVKIFTARVAPTSEGTSHIPIARSAIEKWTQDVFGQALPATSQKDVYCIKLIDDISAMPPTNLPPCQGHAAQQDAEGDNK